MTKFNFIHILAKWSSPICHKNLDFAALYVINALDFTALYVTTIVYVDFTALYVTTIVYVDFTALYVTTMVYVDFIALYVTTMVYVDFTALYVTTMVYVDFTALYVTTMVYVDIVFAVLLVNLFLKCQSYYVFMNLKNNWLCILHGWCCRPETDYEQFADHDDQFDDEIAAAYEEFLRETQGKQWH